MKRRIAQLLLVACTSAASAVMAAEAPIKVAINLVNAQGMASPAGEVTISETPYGLMFQPERLSAGRIERPLSGGAQRVGRHARR